MESTDLDSFWHHLTTILHQLERHYSTDNLALAEQLLIRVEDCQSVLRALLGRVCEAAPYANQVVQDLEYLLFCLQWHFNRLSEWTLIQTTESCRLPQGTCPVLQPSGRGRPPYEIRKEDLEYMLELGFKFSQIAIILGVSERTLRRRREVFGLPIGSECYSDLTDTELDHLVSSIMEVLVIYIFF